MPPQHPGYLDSNQVPFTPRTGDRRSLAVYEVILRVCTLQLADSSPHVPLDLPQDLRRAWLNPFGLALLTSQAQQCWFKNVYKQHWLITRRQQRKVEMLTQWWEECCQHYWSTNTDINVRERKEQRSFMKRSDFEVDSTIRLIVEPNFHTYFLTRSSTWYQCRDSARILDINLVTRPSINLESNQNLLTRFNSSSNQIWQTSRELNIEIFPVFCFCITFLHYLFDRESWRKT